MAITGRPEEAMRLQEQLAQAFLDRLEYEEISYQLSEWYRLAGATGDREGFERARRLQERLSRLGGLGFTGSRYVDLTRARARVCLGLIDDSEPHCTLRSLSADLRVPDHIRWSAVRWLSRLLAERGGDPERETALRLMMEAAAAEIVPQRTARTRLALAEMDAALRQERPEDAQKALSDLERLDPGPVGHLITAAQQAERDSSEYVARFYPY